MNIVLRFYRALTLAVTILILSAAACAAPGDPDQLSQPQASSPTTPATAAAATPPANGTQQVGAEDDGAGGWFARVDKAQASQPSWITPLATTTPRLEEEIRYDQDWQQRGNGSSIDEYDGGKGLELIPTRTNEVIFNAPPYETRSYVSPASGFGDDTFLLIKQRLKSANAQNGNYIVTAFISFLAPTGDDAFGDHAWEITPTIAAGKGYGRSDVQGTLGVSLPTSHVSSIGDPVATNVAFQYNVGKFWPEFEVNDTYWSGGPRGGKNQVLLTPGVVVGRFKLGGRFKANFGVGHQFAVAPALTKEPALTPTYSNAWITTFRVAF